MVDRTGCVLTSSAVPRGAEGVRHGGYGGRAASVAGTERGNPYATARDGERERDAGTDTSAQHGPGQER
ncbi:hypothetical protein SSBG_04072 [Streptomyces sp. SPB074]|nr:hypothetical protein SSBG_04072 [Streptomyces sp. SPB074]